MDHAAPVLDWRPVAETLSALEAEYAQLDALVDDLFAELDKRRSELAQKAAELEQQRREIESGRRELEREREENARLAGQFEHQERQLSEALALLEEVKHDLDEAPVVPDRLTETTQLQIALDRQTREFETLREQRDALQHERDVLSNERLALAARHELVTAELEAARAAAPQWTELTRAIEQIGAGLNERSQAPAPVPERDADDERVALLEQERAALVTELELVRAHSAELHEGWLDQQREQAAQNALLAKEIQSLCQSIDRQAESLEALPRVADAHPIERESPPPPPRADTPFGPAADPVVSSVMAQFAQLQRDVAKRRKRK